MTSRDVTRKKLRHHIGSKKGQGFAERPVSNRVDEAQCFQRTTTSRSVVLVTARARLSAPPAEELDTDTNSGFPGRSLADSPAHPRSSSASLVDDSCQSSVSSCERAPGSGADREDTKHDRPFPAQPLRAGTWDLPRRPGPAQNGLEARSVLTNPVARTRTGKDPSTGTGRAHPPSARASSPCQAPQAVRRPATRTRARAPPASARPSGVLLSAR